MAKIILKTMERKNATIPRSVVRAAVEKAFAKSKQTNSSANAASQQSAAKKAS